MHNSLHTNPEMERSLTYQVNESRTQLSHTCNELELLFNSIDEVLWVFDITSNKVKQISKACKKLYGYEPEDFYSNAPLWTEVVHPDDKKITERATQKLLKGEQAVSQYRITKKDGSIRFVETKTIPTLDYNKCLITVHGITRDITKEKTANKALQESEFLFRQFFENAHEAILVLDIGTGYICDYNPNALQLFKLTGTQMLMQTPVSLSPAFQEDGLASAAKAPEIIERAVRGEKLFLEWQFRDAEGNTIPCEVRLNRINAFGKTLIRGSILDITERRQQEIQLHQQKKFYSSLIENQHDGIVIIDKEARITFQSPSATRISGYSFEEVKNKTMFELVHPDDLPDLGAFFKTIFEKKGVPYTRQFRFIHKQGHSYWVEGTITNMLHDETINGFVANYQNIDERKNTEAEIVFLNETLETKVKERTIELVDINRELETFSYTVSHDLQAPLRSIGGFAKIIVSEYHDKLDNEGQQMLQMISDSAKRMSILIHDLLEFSKLGKAAMEKKAVCMNDIVQDVIDELKFNTGKQEIDVVYSNLPNVDCDPNLIKQVWINLIGNSIKYCGKKEKPVIQVGAEKINNEVVYHVKDNGAGFDMKYADKLFGVFKRMHNNEEFEGTGVGLATVQRIINRHGGRIWAEAEVNRGASFYFTLTT